VPEGGHLDTPPHSADLARSYSPSGLILHAESQGNVSQGRREPEKGRDACSLSPPRFPRAASKSL
jgi:hypothetical protein